MLISKVWWVRRQSKVTRKAILAQLEKDKDSERKESALKTYKCFGFGTNTTVDRSWRMQRTEHKKFGEMPIPLHYIR